MQRVAAISRHNFNKRRPSAIFLSPWIAAIFFLHFCILTSLPQHMLAMKCIVGKWSTWDECYGNCEFAQRVRNRDVIRAPLPQRDAATGRWRFLEYCPVTYEVQECTPKECPNEGPFSIKAPSSMQKGGETRSTLAEEINVAKHHEPRRKQTISVATADVKSANVSAPTGVTLRLAGTKNLYAVEPGRGATSCWLPDKRCCTVEKRALCSDGTKPKQLVKWHRLQGESFCRPYHYPYCGEKEERREGPLVSETLCTEMCFSQAEKVILPDLRIL